MDMEATVMELIINAGESYKYARKNPSYCRKIACFMA